MMEYVTLALIRVLSRCVRRLTLDNAPLISEAMSRNACRIAVLGLTEEAKEACRAEVLNDLLEWVWEDHKRGLSPEMMVYRAVVRALGLLSHASGLRKDYRMITHHAGFDWIWLMRTGLAYARFPLFYYRWRWRHLGTQRLVAIIEALAVVAAPLAVFLDPKLNWPLGEPSLVSRIALATMPAAALIVGMPYLIGAIDFVLWWRGRDSVSTVESGP